MTLAHCGPDALKIAERSATRFVVSFPTSMLAGSSCGGAGNRRP